LDGTLFRFKTFHVAEDVRALPPLKLIDAYLGRRAPRVRTPSLSQCLTVVLCHNTTDLS